MRRHAGTDSGTKKNSSLTIGITELPNKMESSAGDLNLGHLLFDLVLRLIACIDDHDFARTELRHF